MKEIVKITVENGSIEVDHSEEITTLLLLGIFEMAKVSILDQSVIGTEHQNVQVKKEEL